MLLFKESDFVKVKPDFKLFQFKEITCKCCGGFWFDENVSKFLDNLMAFAYSDWKLLLKTTNLHRCVEHNKEIGGASASPHLKSVGCDIYPDSGQLINLFVRAGSSGLFNGVGVYDSGIVHVDNKEREEKHLYWVCWKGKYTYFDVLPDAVDFYYHKKAGM